MREINKLSDHFCFKGKIVCVTGANGFIGKKLVEELIKTECTVRILTRKKQIKFHNNVEVFTGDLTDGNFSIKEFIKNCDILYNCAGEINNETLMRPLHVDGTQKLIEAIKISLI